MVRLDAAGEDLENDVGEDVEIIASMLSLCSDISRRNSIEMHGGILVREMQQQKMD